LILRRPPRLCGYLPREIRIFRAGAGEARGGQGA